MLHTPNANTSRDEVGLQQTRGELDSDWRTRPATTHPLSYLSRTTHLHPRYSVADFAATQHFQQKSSLERRWGRYDETKETYNIVVFKIQIYKEDVSVD